VSKTEELQQQQRVATVKLTGATIQMEATAKLYDASTFIGDNVEADKLRQQLHALLDAKLDHSARIMQLARDIMQQP
jgi:hypothetical protein